MLLALYATVKLLFSWFSIHPIDLVHLDLLYEDIMHGYNIVMVN